MSVSKNNKTGTWEVRVYYKDWTGQRRQTTKRGFAKKSPTTTRHPARPSGKVKPVQKPDKYAFDEAPMVALASIAWVISMMQTKNKLSDLPQTT